MNRLHDRRRFMAFCFPNHFNRGDTYRGVIEPTSNMPMDFQGRYIDGQGRQLDPKMFDFYRRYHFGGQNVPCYHYGGHHYNWSPYYMGYMKGNWYPRFGRQMNFPEKFMDLSNYQMDMQGRWMDMQGHFTNPFTSNSQWRQQNCALVSPQMHLSNYMHLNNYMRFMLRPERYMDMPGYQIEMYNRYPYPFNGNNALALCNRQNGNGVHPYMFNNWRCMFFPERHMDMSNYQMDMQGRWMDMQGRHHNPFHQLCSNRYGFYPGYGYGRNMFQPERYMDMSGYQMDMQGRWMDMGGRQVNPFSQAMAGRNMFYPNRQMDYPERYMDMSGYQMDMQGRWMDMQGHNCNPLNQFMYNRQGFYPGYPQGRGMFSPEYQSEMPARWMEMVGRHANSMPGRQMNHPANYQYYARCMNYPERGMDTSDFQGRWMDMCNRYMNQAYGYYGQRYAMGDDFARYMGRPHQYLGMGNYMDMRNTDYKNQHHNFYGCHQHPNMFNHHGYGNYAKYYDY